MKQEGYCKQYFNHFSLGCELTMAMLYQQRMPICNYFFSNGVLHS